MKDSGASGIHSHPSPKCGEGWGTRAFQVVLGDSNGGYETLILEVRGEVAVVTLNRPKVLHALSARVFDELEAVFKVLGGSARCGWCC